MATVPANTIADSNGKQVVLLKLRKLKPAPKPSSGFGSSQKRPLTCGICCDKFFDHSSLKDHFKKHREVRRNDSGSEVASTPTAKGVKCEICGLISANLSKAMEHKHIKHRFEGKNHSCEFCGRLFAFHFSLMQHKETNHKAEMQAANNPKGATLHCRPSKVNELRSTGKQIMESIKADDKVQGTEFICKFCSIPFLTASALDVHERGVHIFERQMLQKTFLPPPSTKIKVNHNSDVFSVYYCHLCGVEYVLKFNLQKHIQTQHPAAENTDPPAEGLIRCTLCQGIFFTKKAYETHTVYHRPDDLYVINEEHRKQIVNRVNQDFDYRRVPTYSAASTVQKRSRRRSGWVPPRKVWTRNQMKNPCHHLRQHLIQMMKKTPANLL
ncbi:zinc finger protein 26-like isoform X2 [Hermetia illucens]|uniref:zinc finger protein 26-like isoform X2 n=1 Tax=Hermetia illucens TaxID=343691 RepID=UPI0018CC058D|nr:zinc finger protein 26-like isoform X2 [Hermetia illucens]